MISKYYSLASKCYSKLIRWRLIEKLYTLEMIFPSRLTVVSNLIHFVGGLRTFYWFLIYSVQTKFKVYRLSKKLFFGSWNIVLGLSNDTFRSKIGKKSLKSYSICSTKSVLEPREVDLGKKNHIYIQVWRQSDKNYDFYEVFLNFGGKYYRSYGTHIANLRIILTNVPNLVALE